MTLDDLSFASLSALAAARRCGDVSAREIVSHCLGRIARFDATARAFITVTGDGALAAADAADAGKAPSSPLAGMPFATKDLIDIAGVPTTAGSKVLHDYVPDTDAYAIERLRAAGAASLGKTNVHEFAYGATGDNPLYGTATNAWDASRLAGGSSSGSTAAVAYGMVPVALGTDTGGSVRAPAALSGLVGLKPTLGRVSTRGTVPYSWSLDHIGILSRYAEDAAVLLDVIAGHDAGDETSARETHAPCAGTLDGDVAGLRIGIPEAFFHERCDGQILAAADAVRQALERRGARAVSVTLPDMSHSRSVSLTVQMPEALSFHSRYLEDRGDLYGEDFRAGLALGQFLLAEHYIRAKRVIAEYRAATDAVLDDVDVLLTPGAPLIAPKLGTAHVRIDGQDEPVGNAITRYTSFFNMTGHPAVTVPSGLSAEGLPMSVQVIGGAFEEATILNVARAVELSEAFSLGVPELD